ncbi:uncharacterized protein LOC141600481 [Silene latifolia]|uniref:uncharacterized protein LOC141600481 n=1 Tax=Silene latifolia TaxID=37657 RepID=UPI003D786C4D
MEEVDAPSLNPSMDICAQLMQRYSSSTAAQHRHLIATAAALKSLILQQQEILTPLSYFGAAMSALSDTSFQNDAASSSALATLLSIALPLVPQGSISPQNASHAANVLVRVLGDAAAVASASAAKCVVKCLGVLLGFCDFSTWNSLQLPFETLLNWCIDKRPKVRKCALVYLENAFKSSQSESVTERASELILSSLENCMSSAEKLGILKKLHGPGSDTHHEAECSDIIHVLGVVRVSLPYLSNQVSVNIINKLLKLLDARLSAFTRLILSAIEVFLDKADIEVITLVDEAIIDALASYLSTKTNSADSLLLAAKLVKVALDKMHSGDTSKWQKCFSPGVKAIAGLLTCEDDIASEASNILKKLIDHQLVDFESQQAIDAVKDPKSNTIASICSVFMSLLESFPDIPNEHTLAVISVLFLKLGRNSSLYMRNIVLKMAEILIAADVNECDTSHVQKCFGCAVVALGAEDILGLVPFSFNSENLTCSNMWLLPILNKYTFGASLRYFMDHIVPIAKSLKKAARKVKKSVTGQDLQAHAQGLWGLLPAFCRHPTDISESFQSLSKLMLVQLKKDTTRHEDIAEALQELVRRSECRSKSDVSIAESPERSSDALLEDDLLEKRALIPFSKKDAKRDVKTLSSQSNELLQALMTIFLDAPPENRSSLKKAIGCLASITKSSSAKKIFILSLERFPLVKAVIESGDLPDGSQNEMPCSVGAESQWPLSLDLASSFVKGADEDFLGLIFRLAKHSLQVGDEIGAREAYYTLSCILMDHPKFCSSNLDELVDLISKLKSPADIASFSNRLSCLRLLLVSVLKSSSDVENTKPFLILNCIILALKDSKEEARKIAYDELLKISSCLEELSSADSCGLYYKLISMILGYLSGPSPHITSAAVSALSVLVFKEPELCVKVPDLVPSVTSLLQAKAVEVTKAVLGFIKVLVSCVEGEHLHNFASIIMDGLLPWSSVSRHHFRSKVTVIIEIMIRKCGFPAVKLVTPERYQPFIRKVSLNRQGKTTTKEADSVDMKQESSDISTIRPKKRIRNETQNDEGGSRFNREKRQKQSQGSHPRGTVERSDFRSSRKPNNHVNQKNAGIGGKSEKSKTHRDKTFGRPRQTGPRNKQRRSQ